MIYLLSLLMHNHYSPLMHYYINIEYRYIVFIHAIAI